MTEDIKRISILLTLTLIILTGIMISAPMSQTVYAEGPLTITTDSLPDGYVGTPYSFTMTATGGTDNYTWSIDGEPALPAGLSLDADTGVISGTPQFSGETADITFKVDDGVDIVTKQLTLLVYASPLSITTESLPDGGVGVAYAETLTATGGTGVYEWSITTGSLPTGLNLNAGTGEISGTPSADGTFNFTVRVVSGAAALKNLSIYINPQLVITTASLPDGILGTAYSYTLEASGGTGVYIWDIVSGSLPAELSLDEDTGEISGTPTVAGTSNIEFQVTDSLGSSTTKELSLKIFASPLFITTLSPLPEGDIEVEYSYFLEATGGTGAYAWSKISGNLPTGITLAGDGEVSGTATEEGIFNFTARAVSGDQAADKTFDITFNPLPDITTTSPLPDGEVDIPYSYTLAAQYGTGAYTWEIDEFTPLPDGLGLNPTTGLISGTPTTAGTDNVTATVTDSVGGSDTATLEITILEPPVIITESPLPTGEVGVAYLYNLEAEKGTGIYTWSITASTLPPGLTLNANTGVISGTSTAAVTNRDITFRVTDSLGGIDSQVLRITILPRPNITSPSPLPDGEIGVEYSYTLTATNGTGPGTYTWSIATGVLPDGLSLDEDTGEISGTPTTAGSTTITFRVTDELNGTATRALILTILPAVNITSTSLPDGEVGINYSRALTATGGKTLYSWEIIGGGLPPGLNLSTAGRISGTPTTAGTDNATFKITDSLGGTDQKAISITIHDALVITQASPLDDGEMRIPYNLAIEFEGGKEPYTWTITSGSLPSGLTLNRNTGVISGTPGSASARNVTIRVTDSLGGIATKLFNITILRSPAITSTVATVYGTIDTPYSKFLTANYGKPPYTWSITSGTLPATLVLNAETGEISGTPEALGRTNVTFRVTDSLGGTGTKMLTIQIFTPPTITTTSLPEGEVNVLYSALMRGTNGRTPYTWTVSEGTLPNGLTLYANGRLTGRPLQDGTFEITIQCNDSASGTDTKEFTIVIQPAVTIETTTLENGNVGVAYNQALIAAGGKEPYRWSIASGALPAGLSLNSTTGVISGTPRSAITRNVTFRVRDALNGIANKLMTITIEP